MKKLISKRAVCHSCDERIEDKLIELWGADGMSDANDYMYEDNIFYCNDCSFICDNCFETFLSEYDDFYCNCGFICDDCSDKCNKCDGIYCIKCNIPCLQCTQEIVEQYIIKDISHIIFKYYCDYYIFNYYESIAKK